MLCRIPFHVGAKKLLPVLCRQTKKVKELEILRIILTNYSHLWGMANLVPRVLSWERGWGIACDINMLKKIEPYFSA